MKITGKIDNQGRITIPYTFRKLLNIEPNSELLIELNKRSVRISNLKHICPICFKQINNEETVCSKCKEEIINEVRN